MLQMVNKNVDVGGKNEQQSEIENQLYWTFTKYMLALKITKHFHCRWRQLKAKLSKISVLNNDVKTQKSLI